MERSMRPYQEYRDAIAGMGGPGNRQTNVIHDDHRYGWHHGCTRWTSQISLVPAKRRANGLSHGHGIRLERLRWPRLSMYANNTRKTSAFRAGQARPRWMSIVIPQGHCESLSAYRAFEMRARQAQCEKIA